MSATLQLTEALISRPSPTPNDGGCQDLIAARLRVSTCLGVALRSSSIVTGLSAVSS